MSLKLVKTKRRSIYDYDDRIKRTFNLIEKELSDNNIELIHKYDRLMITEGHAKATRHKHLQTLLNLSRFLKKDWIDATTDDIDKIVMIIHDRYADERGKETNSTYDHKKVLKIFFRWLKLGSRSFTEVGDPHETKHIKMKKVADKISREELITEDDLTRLLHVCGENQRDRAFIDCQHEAGTRPGEILSLKIKHVKFDDHGAVIHVDGKTGARPVRLIRSSPNLSQWINVHPLREDKEAPLWIDLGKRNYGNTMTYAAALTMVKRRCRQAHISKRIYLNLFRHSEATATANYLTEAQMRKRHGWTPFSKMPGRYVHLVNADVDDAIFKHYGIEKTEQDKTVHLPKKCPICDMVNSPEEKFCSKCHHPLDLKTALEKQEKDQLEKDSQNKKMDRIEKKLETLELVLSHTNLTKAKVLVKKGTKILLQDSEGRIQPVSLNETIYNVGEGKKPLQVSFGLEKN